MPQVLCHAQHRVGFLIAEKSWNTPIIGHCAQLCGSMPVKRPQDAAQKGIGVLVGFSEETARRGGTVTGKGTAFKKQVAKGDKVSKLGCVWRAARHLFPWLNPTSNL
jgi:1-acyl-sn-glycerol-3-phosphate acyltransferase